MKKLIILLIAVAVIIGLSFYISSLFKNEGKSDTELIDFAIKDISTVDKVIITDKSANSFEIRKKGKVWTDKDGGCITQASAEFILDALRDIEFKGYLPDSSHTNYTRMMTAQHLKVEIFQNGEWTKTWYLGPTAADHHGQIMLLDSKEYGQSDIPVLMKIKGLNGIIEPRFFADKREWACTNVFSLSIEEIASVDVKFNDEPERSFKVTKNGSELKVYSQGKQLLEAKPDMMFRYLNNFKKIHYNLQNFELTKSEVDSLKRTTPFAIMNVKETSGKTTKLRCFRINDISEEETDFGDIQNTNRDKFWCELSNGMLVKCQYFSFNPILLGHIYFPMDLSMLKTVDGIREK